MGAESEAEWPGAHLYGVTRHPRISGWVVAEAHLNRDLAPKVFVHSVPSTEWTTDASKTFVDGVLPKVSEWLIEELAKTEIELSEPVQLVVEWTGGRFLFHKAVMRGRS